MLTELAVEYLGVIERLNLVLGPGMTALTGETGAGKTLVVTAVDLLLGGRADPALVRLGASEAVVEGRFDHQGEEVVSAAGGGPPMDGPGLTSTGGSHRPPPCRNWAGSWWICTASTPISRFCAASISGPHWIDSAMWIWRRSWRLGPRWPI